MRTFYADVGGGGGNEVISNSCIGIVLPTAAAPLNGKQMPTNWSLACWQASLEVFPVFSWARNFTSTSR